MSFAIFHTGLLRKLKCLLLGSHLLATPVLTKTITNTSVFHCSRNTHYTELSYTLYRLCGVISIYLMSTALNSGVGTILV